MPPNEAVQEAYLRMWNMNTTAVWLSQGPDFFQRELRELANETNTAQKIRLIRSFAAFAFHGPGFVKHS